MRCTCPGTSTRRAIATADAVAAFTSAAANELGYMNADVLYSNGHHGHNVHYLVHALNMDGRYRESMLQARHLLSFRETPRERQGANQRVTWRQGYYALIKTLVRFERWDDVLDGRTIPSYDRAEQRAWRAWAEGLAHSAKGHAAEAQTSLDALTRAVSESTATKPPLDVAVLELRATIAARAGDASQAAKLFREAADREIALHVHRAALVPASGGRRLGARRRRARRFRDRGAGLARGIRARAGQRTRVLRPRGRAPVARPDDRVADDAGAGGEGVAARRY